MQQIYISLGGPGTLRPEEVSFLYRGDLHVSYLPGATEGGRASVLIAARQSDGRIVGIELTARNLVGLAAGIRGKLVEAGEINVALDPGIAMVADAETGVVHFAAEAPLQSWDFTAAQAIKWAAALKDLAEAVARKPE